MSPEDDILDLDDSVLGEDFDPDKVKLKPEKSAKKACFQRDRVLDGAKKLKKERDTLKGLLQESVKRCRKADREKDLITLKSEGVLFDLNEELDVSLNDKQWTSKINKMKKYYQKAPINTKFAVVQPTEGKGCDDLVAAVNAGKMSRAEALNKLAQG